MKILASNKPQYGRTVYIAQLNSDELRALTLTYGKIAVTEESGVVGERDFDDLNPGCTISPDASKEKMETILAAIGAREEIEKAFTFARGAFTKVLNAFPC